WMTSTRPSSGSGSMARNSSATWSSMRSRIGSATSAAPKDCSSASPRSSGPGRRRLCRRARLLDDVPSLRAMKNGLRTILKGHSAKLGVIAGLFYGVFARYVAETQVFGDAFTVMSLAFLVLVPMVLGFLTVNSTVAPSIAYRIFAPWGPALLGVLIAAAIGWEGAICIL